VVVATSSFLIRTYLPQIINCSKYLLVGIIHPSIKKGDGIMMREPESILAAVPATVETWDAEALLQQLSDHSKRRLLYKRVDNLSSAFDRMTLEERWERLRILIVSRGTLFEAIDPENGTTTSQPKIMETIKAHYSNALKKLLVIGISQNDMYATLLSRMGCDVTCDPDNIVETISDLMV
jgi:hypothetical protein